MKKRTHPGMNRKKKGGKRRFEFRRGKAPLNAFTVVGNLLLAGINCLELIHSAVEVHRFTL